VLGMLSRLMGRASSQARGGARSHGLRAPVVMDRRCPEAFRRRLQLSAPTLDCVYFGDGQWIIVVYRGDGPRRREGEKLHWNAATLGITDPSVYQQAALMRDGWAGLHQFAAVEPCEQHAVEALRKFHATDADVRAGLQAAGDESRSVSRKRRLAAERSDFLETEARSIWRHTVRRPVSIIRPVARAH